MAPVSQSNPVDPAESAPLRAVLGIVLIGLALGVGFNWLGLRSEPAWGIAWIGTDPLEDLPTLGSTSGGSASGAVPVTMSNDPMAIAPAAAHSNGVPDVPDLDRPIQIGLQEVRQFVDASAALIIDARETEEYAEGHLPNAINLPFDEVITDPTRLENLSSNGRPYIIYCGGGTCELSLTLAEELLFLGHRKVLVYMGGFPEWQGAGFPVERGSGQG